MLLFAIQSALAVGLSWQLAVLLLGREAAALAVVSAIVVVHTTGWETLRKSMERTLGVILGVSVAVLVAHFVGLNVATIAVLSFLAQIVGGVLQNRGQSLATQIPVSAALVLLLGADGGAYPRERLLGTIVGAIAGTLVSLLLAPPIYVLRTRNAVADLTANIAEALSELAEALAARLRGPDASAVHTHIRELEQHLPATQQGLAQAMDSTRLNPWARGVRPVLVAYPGVLLALDRLVRQMRRIALTLDEPEPSWADFVQQEAWAGNYAGLLTKLGAILAVATEFLRAHGTISSGALPNRATLNGRLEHARRRLIVWQTQLAADAPHADSSAAPVVGPAASPGYRLAVRGAILTDFRRMLNEVQEVVDFGAQPPLIKP